MKKYLIFGLVAIVALTIVAFFSDSKEKNIPRNERVMYGYADYDSYVRGRTEAAKELDEQLIEDVMKFSKTRSEATQKACDRGYDYLNKGDYKTAIKRFNQGWLIDHEHFCVYAGYGYYYGTSAGDFENSFMMYEKALAKVDKENSWWILTDYAEMLDACYEEDNKRTDCLEKAQTNIVASQKIKDSPKTHRVMAFVSYHQGEYAKSWNEVHLAIDGGVSKEIMSPFIKVLKKEMPDPKGLY